MTDTATKWLRILQKLVAEHEDMEDRAPVDPFCGECNLNAGPHKEVCAYHSAKAALREIATDARAQFKASVEILGATE